MKKHRMPFEYWLDDHTALIQRSKPPQFLDPDYYVEAHFHPPRASAPYFLNRRCRRLYDRDGPFRDNYHDAEELVDSAVGADAYVVCPGPSLASLDISRLDGRLTLAVNSAGFLMRPSYWVMAESAYARWMIGPDGPEELPDGRRIVATARVAVCLRDHEQRQRRRSWEVYVARWEEEKVVPPRVPAVSTFNAMVTAWEMGCSRIFLLGLDLSKEGGAYVAGVPFTREGAANPFDDQIRAIRQFALPGIEVVNCSPLSRESLPFEHATYDEALR